MLSFDFTDPMELPFLILGLVPIFIIVVWVLSRYICNLLNAPQAILDLLEPTRERKKYSTPAVISEDSSHLVTKLFRGSTGSFPTSEELKMFSKLTRKELIEISKTTKGYDPRFKIDDLLQFED